MDIKELRENWNKLSKSDPLWAIISRPDKKGNKWQINEFFKTGVEEVDSVMRYIKALDINIPHRKALDFGCGVGRLSQAFTSYFDEVHGIDIAPRMIELARKYNHCPDKCTYHLCKTDDLRLFADNSFDFIYTNITLQHIGPRYSKSYITEFLRTLSPHGLLIFQLPSKARIINETGTINLKGLVLRFVPKSLLDATYFKAKYGSRPRIEMYCIKRKEVVRFLKENGARIVDIAQDRYAGDLWISFRYCVTKK